MPFEKGKSGNPSGRKHEKLVRTALAMELAAAAGDTLEGIRRIWRPHIRKALSEDGADLATVKEIFDRHDGKVPQGIVGGDEDDNPVNVLNTIRREIVKPDNPNG